MALLPITWMLLIIVCLNLFKAFAAETNGTIQVEVTTTMAETTRVESKLPDFNCQDEILIENEYVILENGSLLVPQNNHVYDETSYNVKNETAFICATNNQITEVRKEEANTQYNFSDEFLSCGHILIEPHEYTMLKNGTVFIEIYKRYYEPRDFYLQEETGVYVCIPNFVEMHANLTNGSMTDTAKFSEAFIYVSHIGMSISILSLILHLVVFCSVEKVRNLPGYCLASLSLSLLIAYLCFVSSSAANNKDQCAKVGLCIYYFFLTTFFWMNTIAFDVWRSFRVFVSKMRVTRNRVPWRKFLLYCAYSWLIPAILAIVAEWADRSDFLPEEYRPSFGAVNCWFGQRKALIVFFAIPLCVIMVLNGIFFLDSAYVIHRTTMKTATVNEMLLKQRFLMFMRLALLMGLTWIVGIVAGYVNHEVIWYGFVILNTLQGLFIFIVFSCSAKVRTFLVKKIKGRSSTSRGTSVKTISQMSNVL